jgi:hypothetical protein
VAKAILIALAVLLVAAPVSHAAVAEVEVGGGEKSPPGRSVSYSADPGEANRVTVVDEGRASRIRDDGAELRAGTGCDQVSPHEVLCHAQGLSALLDDGDDSLTAPNGGVHGGPGNDVLRIGGLADGGPGDDVLHGRGGNDRLDGGGGRDVLRGAGGDDYLSDGDRDYVVGGIGPDVLDGGTGLDLVSYSPRGARLVIDLRRRGGQGGPGEGDTLRSVESVVDGGGLEPSILTGDGGPNGLDVFADHSVARGLGGDDYLTAWSERRDVLSAGAGDDILERSDYPAGVPDTLSCGSGRDEVYLAQDHESQFVPPDCEWVRDADEASNRYHLLGPLQRADAAVMRLTMGECLTDFGDCTLVWALRREVGHGAGSSGPLLAKQVEHVRRNRRGHLIALRLTRAGRALVARHRSVRARFGFLGGGRVNGGFVIKLRLCRTLTRSC